MTVLCGLFFYAFVNWYDISTAIKFIQKKAASIIVLIFSGSGRKNQEETNSLPSLRQVWVTEGSYLFPDGLWFLVISFFMCSADIRETNQWISYFIVTCFEQCIGGGNSWWNLPLYFLTPKIAAVLFVSLKK